MELLAISCMSKVKSESKVYFGAFCRLTKGEESVNNKAVCSKDGFDLKPS